MIAMLNIGNTYRNMGELDLAPDYLYKANEFFENNNYTILRIVSNLFLGQLFLDRGEYDTALNFAKKSLGLASMENFRERMKDAHELIAGVYKNQKDYQSAFEHIQIYQQIKDSLLSAEQNSRFNERRIRFEVEEKDREIRLQEAKIIQQNLSLKFLFTGLGLMAVIIGLLVYNNHQKNKSNALLKQRRLEIEEQNKQLARLNKEKDEFLSMAAHDLRNPLSTIMGAVNLLRTEEELEENDIDEYSQLIETSSNRMFSLINSFLEIKSNENGDHNLPVSRVDVNKAIKQSIRHFQKSADAKSIELLKQLVKVPGPVLGNTNSLIRIFDNLISNAVKFSPEGKQVIITSTVEDDCVRVSIRDEGPGLSKDDHAKLFGQYARLSTQPTGNETSTGLGLYIVKKITTSLNGRVWCTSEPGQGAVFYVEFPKADSPT